MRHDIVRLMLRVLSAATGLAVLAVVPVLGQQPQPTSLPKAQAAPAALPQPKDIIAKHVAAIGGEAAFKAVKSIHAKGEFELSAQGVKGDLEIIAARPAKLLLKVEIPSVGHVESGYDGKNGWTLDPLEGPKLLQGRALTEMAEDAWFDSTLHSADHVKSMTTVSKTEFDKRPAYEVKVVFQSGVEQTEYFDAETGLQIGTEAQRDTPMGVLPTTTLIREYKKFGSVMQATVLLQRTMGIDQVLRLSSVEYNTVPATAFDPPPPIKALIK